ncbi:hypothetical protein BsWGS_20799 [Bradybaena similaris]
MESSIPVLLVLISVSGTLCQEINFTQYPKIVSECYFKARDNQDSFFFTGTVGTNMPLLIGQGWSSDVNLEFKMPADTLWRVFCALTFENGVCQTRSNYSCTCYMKMNNMNFRVNFTLQKINSGGYLRALWTNTLTNNKVYSNWEYKLPEICDVTTARLNLTIDGVNTDLESMGHCTYSITLFQATRLLLCCSDMAMPCYSQILFLGTVVATDESPCVTYSSTFGGVTGVLQLAYSVCGLTDYIAGALCNVTFGMITTRDPTAGTVTTSRQTQMPIVVPTRSLTQKPGEVSTGTQAPTTNVTLGGETSSPTSDEHATATKAPAIHASIFQTIPLKNFFWSIIALVALAIFCASLATYILLNKRRRNAADRANRSTSQSKASEASTDQKMSEIRELGSSVD